MGSTIADYDQDGDLDWFVSAISPAPDITGWGFTSGNRLYRNLGGRRFEDATDEAGVRYSAWGWGSAFWDADNDLDLVVTNGYAFFGAASDRTRFYERTSATGFDERAAAVGLDDDRQGKGLVVLDYDQDGDLDLFVVNSGNDPLLLRNDSPARRWLRVRATGAVSTRDAHGASVVVSSPTGATSTQYGLIDSSTHFLGQSEGVAHFGLGDLDPSETFDIAVRFASGHVVNLTGVTLDQTVSVAEPTSAAPLPPAPLAYPPCEEGPAEPCAPDCDGNGIVDACDLLTAQDCDINAVLDVCELASGTAEDCDGDGLLDACWLEANPGGDANGNGVPDPCDGFVPDAGAPDDGGTNTAMDAAVAVGDLGGVADAGTAPDAGRGALRDGGCGVAGPWGCNGESGCPCWVFLLALAVRRRIVRQRPSVNGDVAARSQGCAPRFAIDDCTKNPTSRLDLRRCGLIHLSDVRSGCTRASPFFVWSAQ